jgi:PPM family protein phosphatase
MGRTVAELRVSGDSAVVENVGDSRAYLFRQRELRQITVDDSLLNSTSKGGLAEADFGKSPRRDVLTQAAGAEAQLDVHISELKLESDDLLLLSSDGLQAIIATRRFDPSLVRAEPWRTLAIGC